VVFAELVFLCCGITSCKYSLWQKTLLCRHCGLCVPITAICSVDICNQSVLFSEVFQQMGVVFKVESVEAVKNIPEIAAVEGVDCIQMGPLDLRADMGLLGFPTDSSPSNLLREAEETVKSTGVYLCGFATADDSPSALMELGYDMVSGAVDVGLLRNAAVADVQQHKQKTKKKKEKLDNSKFSKIL
jgi:hypothetical protein